MGDVLAVVKNEWMKLKHRRRFLVVLAIAALMLCALTGISYMENRNRSTIDTSLQDQEMELKSAEEALGNWDTSGGSWRAYESKEALIAGIEGMKKSYEREKELTHGDWRAVLEEDKKRAEAVLQGDNDEKNQKNYAVSEIGEINYYLHHDIKPRTGWELSPYNQLEEMNVALVMLFVPFLVIFLVADIVSSETSSGTIKLLLIRPISRFKILLGKWIVSIIAAVLFSLLFYTVLWCMHGILFGFSTGMWDPKWLNVVTESKQVMDEYGNVNMDITQFYDNAYIIPAWLHFVYMVLLSSVAMILIATIAFFCTTIFKTVIMSTGVAFVIVVVGVVLNMVVSTPANKIWLFTSHLDLMQHWSGVTEMPSLMAGLMVLTGWFIVAIIPTFYLFQKRDVFNA